MTTINNIDDLVRILRERPEWLKAVRELVLTDELLRLPETVAQLAEELREYAKQTNERLDRLEATLTQLVEFARQTNERLDRLEAGQTQANERLDRTERRLDRIENQLNDVRGDTFEITAARRIMPELFRQLGIYGCDTIIGPGITLARERIDDIRRAQTEGAVERNSEYEIAYADLVLYGRRDSDDSPVWVAIEASVKIDEHDVSRARQRADILAAVYEEPAWAVVAGESIDDRDRTRANDAGVVVINIRPRYRPES